MRNAVFYKTLKIELFVIIVLLLAILAVSVLNDRKRQRIRRSAPIMEQQSDRFPPESEVFIEDGHYTAFGLASYYDPEFQGNLTASGEIYDPTALTAAHRDLPFNTRVRVTNMESGQQVVVRINDRGPLDDARILDVSEKAAQKLGIFGSGTARVRLEVLE